MANYSQTQKDWGITAEFQWYYDMHNNITTLVAEHWSLATTIEALQHQLEQSQQCLFGSHAYEWYQLFMPSTRVPTSTLSQKEKGSLPPSLTVHTAVQLDSNQRVMSQSSLPGGKRTADGIE